LLTLQELNSEIEGFELCDFLKLRKELEREKTATDNNLFYKIKSLG